MLGNNNVDQAVVLPSIFGSPADAMSQAINVKQQQQQRSDILSQRQMAFNQRLQTSQQNKNNTNKLHNLNALTKATDYQQYTTPDQHINELTQRGLKDIYDKGILNISQDPEVAASMLKNEMAELMNWHSLAKTDLGNAKAQQLEINKNLPNADLNKVTKIFSDQIQNNYAQQDPRTGQWSRKSSNLIKQGVNYSEPFENPEILGSVTNDSSPLKDYFGKIVYNDAGDKSSTNKKGVVNNNAWTAKVSKFTEIGDDEKGNLKAITKFVPMQIGFQKDGVTPQIIKGATDEMVKEVMQGKPSVKAAALMEFSNWKQSKGIQNASPSANEVYFKNYLYEAFDNNLDHQVKTATAQATPKTVNNFNLGGSGVKFNDIAKQLNESLFKSGSPTPMTQLPSEAREYFTNSINQGREYKLDLDQLGVVKGEDNKYRVVEIDKKTGAATVKGVFSETGTNLKANTGAKPKQAVLNQQNEQSNYTQITNTDKGKMGVKNGKWYYIETGKEYK